MDPDEIENVTDVANDTVEPSDDDTLDEFVYHDPDEDQDTEETEQSESTDDETDDAETQDEEESEESEDQTDDKADITVSLDDGTDVSLEELKKGYFRQSDYSRKTAETAEMRKTLEAQTQRVEGVTQALVDHIASMIPQEPDPALALSDPNKFVAQKAQYDAAVAQVQKLMDVGAQVKSVDTELSQGDQQKAYQEANAQLAEMFPATRKEDTRKKFFEAANQAALDVGFSPSELGAVTDPKLIALAHWARIGMDAQKAKAKVREKVQKAPPAAPRKPGSAKNSNAAAMSKLTKSGSLSDALAVDFD